MDVRRVREVTAFVWVLVVVGYMIVGAVVATLIIRHYADEYPPENRIEEAFFGLGWLIFAAAWPVTALGATVAALFWPIGRAFRSREVKR